MNIGVIGGTFDPVHKGHLALAACALDEYVLDKVWFMPAGDPYFKEGKQVSSPETRLEMTERCMLPLAPYFEVSDYEIRKEGRTYSAETFSELSVLYPDERFYFIVGLDSLQAMDSWYHPEILFEHAVILAADRKGEGGDQAVSDVIEQLKEKYSCDIRIVHMPPVDISSSMIREMAARGEDISPYVTREVLEYIEEKGLYRPLKA